MLHVVHHPAYVSPATPGSRFRFDKYGLVMEALREVAPAMTLHTPDAMPRAWIEAVHDPAYVEEVLTLTTAASETKWNRPNSRLDLPSMTRATVGSKRLFRRHV